MLVTTFEMLTGCFSAIPSARALEVLLVFVCFSIGCNFFGGVCSSDRVIGPGESGSKLGIRSGDLSFETEVLRPDKSMFVPKYDRSYPDPH